MLIDLEEKEFIKNTFNIDLDKYNEKQQVLVVENIKKYLDTKIEEEKIKQIDLQNKINELINNNQE